MFTEFRIISVAHTQLKIYNKVMIKDFTAHYTCGCTYILFVHITTLW